MFFSLIQTLICVLLINGGLYALHLKSNVGNAAGSLTNSNPPVNMLNILGNNGHNNRNRGETRIDERLGDELADLAQLERERLMLLGIAKQTATGVAGQHGRPIITGRIHMSPTDEMLSEDYGSLLLPSKNYMFGHVVEQPSQQHKDMNAANEFAGGGKPQIGLYEYGRVVQPPIESQYDPQQQQQQQQQHRQQQPLQQQLPLDLDAFVDLEPNIDDDFDLDSYQYLEDLLAEKQHINNPYHEFEQNNPPIDLRELFNKEQHHHNHHLQQQTQSQSQQQQQQQQQPQEQQDEPYYAKTRNGGYRQQPKKRIILPQRHIFGQKQQRIFQQQQQQLLLQLLSQNLIMPRNCNNLSISNAKNALSTKSLILNVIHYICTQEYLVIAHSH